MRLNQYIAHSGLCSRRDADQLIKNGEVVVNGAVVNTMGLVVGPDDIVKVKGKLIKPERFIYILLNKPKDYITTTSDEKDRKTVVDIIMPKLMQDKSIGNVRIYPVGRLDRNTTGLLLLTNDGELTQRLTHPKFNIEKIYVAELDNEISMDEMEKIAEGLELEDGFIKVDDIAYSDPRDYSKVGVAIHSGKNRIVRRIFEHMGYQVKYLDRIVFAGLTKKNLPRGSWRFLTEEEVLKLKNLNNPNKKFIPPSKSTRKDKDAKKIRRFR
jgi:23S rRNA pseudouridine2605 synthase